MGQHRGGREASRYALGRRSGGRELPLEEAPFAVVAAWIGLVVPVLRPVYDYAWFVGFGVAAVVYWATMKTTAPATSAVATPDLP